MITERDRRVTGHGILDTEVIPKFGTDRVRGASFPYGLDQPNIVAVRGDAGGSTCPRTVPVLSFRRQSGRLRLKMFERRPDRKSMLLPMPAGRPPSS
jgi:hypothetical protein